jgi:hypothetical protein
MTWTPLLSYALHGKLKKETAGGSSLQATSLLGGQVHYPFIPDTLKNLSTILQRGELLIAMLGMFWLYSQGPWLFGRNQVASVAGSGGSFDEAIASARPGCHEYSSACGNAL